MVGRAPCSHSHHDGQEVEKRNNTKGVRHSPPGHTPGSLLPPTRLYPFPITQSRCGPLQGSTCLLVRSHVMWLPLERAAQRLLKMCFILGISQSHQLYELTMTTLVNAQLKKKAQSDKSWVTSLCMWMESSQAPFLFLLAIPMHSFFFLISFFWDRASGRQGWLWIWCVTQDDPELLILVPLPKWCDFRAAPSSFQWC